MTMAFPEELASGRGPTDSGNRPVMQVVPLAMLYFAVQFAPMFHGTKGDRDDERARSPEGTTGTVPGDVDAGDGAARPHADVQ